MEGNATVTIDPLLSRSNQEIIDALRNDKELLKKLTEAYRLSGSSNPGQTLKELQKAIPEFHQPERWEGLKDALKPILEEQGLWKGLPPKFPEIKGPMPRPGSVMGPEFPEKVPKEGPPVAPRAPRRMSPVELMRRPPNGLKNLKPNAEVLRWLRRNLGDRPELAELMKDINSDAASRDWQNSAWFGSVQSEASDFGKWMGRQDIRIPDIGWNSAGLSAPKLNLPTVGIGGGAPVTSGGETSSAAVILPVLLAGMALLGYFRKRLRPGAKAAGDRRVLSADLHFDPRAVESAGQLVAAYDKLAVRTLGDAARNWNHRTVAGGLNRLRPERGASIAELSALYEKARYAEAGGELSEVELAAGRRHLADLSESEIR